MSGALLAFDSATGAGSVAVGIGGQVVAEIGSRPHAGHSSALLPAADYALRSVGLGPSDLGGIVVGSGPGSFTGIRIAAAMAKGMVQALGVPLFAYSSLLACAARAWAAAGPVCAMFDARGRDVFVATYRFGPTIEVLRSPASASLDEVVELYMNGEVPLFVGDGAVR